MRHHFWPYVLLAVLCGMLFFWRLGAIPLMGLDEGLYSECSREMLASGDYVVPTCNGGTFFDKPPIAYWLQAGSMSAFGVNSFAARLPSAVEELLLVGLTVFLGTRLFSRRAGLMAGFALASSILAAGLARMAILDAAFTLAITASLGAFLLAHLRLAPRWWYLLFWAAMGLSVMIKGPAGAVLILTIIAVFLLIRREPQAFSRTMPIAGVLVFLAVAVPWYALVQHQTGGAFLREFVIHQNIQRALGRDFQHNMPFWFYLPVYLVLFFPWSVFLPAALGQSKKRVIEKTPKVEDTARVFLTVWIAVVFCVFSVFKSKLPAYIFPVYPASALLVGMLWARAVQTGEFLSLRRGALAASIVACVIGAGMLVAPSLLRDPIPGLATALIPMGVCLVTGCVLGYVLLVFKRPVPAFCALCCGMGAFVGFAIWLGLPIAARTNALPAMAMARVIAGRTEPTFAYRLSPPQPQLGFYASRPIPRTDDASDVPTERRCLVVVQEDRYDDLPVGGKIEATVGPYKLLRFSPLSGK